ncbi:hypothetical protein J8F10_18130 [Gemmata sp. G18]|uniref:Uncharacterized protein n=1 Tax=Gemmata palustris TaxID=2822762 RepID=A0ABS5BU21_9BACT|nr:hypothetical protein [Gemmata palustris]MBP3957184.1 hypothetical protein [Gemmata palustris]
MIRLTALIILGSAGLAFSPATASAQFGPRPSGFGPVPVIVPSFNPFFYVPQYRYQSNTFLNLQGPLGTTTLSTSRYYYGVNPVWSVAPAYPAIYSQAVGSSYSTMGVRPNVALEAQRDLMRAQRAMSAQVPPATSKAVVGEKPVAPAVIESSSPMPEGFPALTPAERARVLSGEALNELLAAIVKAEAKAGARSSAFVPNMLLDDVRFGGSDAADTLNLARRATSLDFPAAFDNAALKDDRIALTRDFAAVTERLQAGKAVDPTKRDQFEVTLQKAEAALASIVKTLPADDATAANRFLGQMTGALKVMKTEAATGLIDPKWASEGTTVADLVKHMTRFKVQFAAATTGNEEAYLTLHRNFASYLFFLTQPKK